VCRNYTLLVTNNLFNKGLKMFNEIYDEIKNESELTELKKKKLKNMLKLNLFESNM
jgi:hypothetical protein